MSVSALAELTGLRLARHAPRLGRLAAVPPPWASFYLVLCSAALQPFTSFRLTGAITLGDGFMFAALLALLPSLLLKRARLWLPWWLAGSAALLLVGLLARSELQDVYAWDDIVHTLTIIYCAHAIPVILASQPGAGEPRLRLLAGVWLTAHLASALCAIGQAQGFGFGPLAEYLGPCGNRCAGFTMHPNNLGIFLGLTLPVLLIELLAAAGALRHIALTAVLAVVLYGINLTGSRTGLLAGVLSCAVPLAFPLLRWPGRGWSARILKSAFLMLVAALLWFYLADNRAEYGALSRLLYATGEAEDASRQSAELGALAWRSFLDNPALGVGFGDVIAAHNVWLMLLSSGGVLAMLAILMRDLGIGFLLLRASRTAPRGAATWIALGCLGAFSAWQLIGLRGTPLIERDGGVIQGIGILAALSLARAQAVAKAGAR